MATEKKAAKKTAKKAAAKGKGEGRGKNLPKLEKPKFGVEALAKELGVTEMTARVKLRNSDVKKDGRVYDFKDAAGVKKVAKQLAA